MLLDKSRPTKADPSLFCCLARLMDVTEMVDTYGARLDECRAFVDSGWAAFDSNEGGSLPWLVLSVSLTVVLMFPYRRHLHLRTIVPPVLEAIQVFWAKKFLPRIRLVFVLGLFIPIV